MTSRRQILLLLAGAPLGAQQAPIRHPDVRYEPSTPEQVQEMLRLAGVKKTDIVYDLGSGDGRIVIAAAKDYGARGVGIDIDPQRTDEANANAKAAGVTQLVKFRTEDLFEADVREATVVMLYLWPWINLKLRPKLLAELKPGSRIVSHYHDMGDWPPEKKIEVGGHFIFLWTVPGPGSSTQQRYTAISHPGRGDHSMPDHPVRDPVTWLYPPIEPYNTGRLRVSPIHDLYFEESGNPGGKPVIFLHGGPGGGSDPKQRRFFHPAKYRIINFDQRGCGKSTPYASLEDNTTWDLVADIEKLREHLGIERWQVFGGSWGSTLALAYAETHPARVTELVLRGIFPLREQEIDWFYQRGASVIYPDAWEPYLAHIPEAERGDLLSAYHRRLTSEDPAVRLAAAKIWSGWEGATSKLLPDAAFTGHYEEDEFALAFARIEVHYFINKGFFETDGQLLHNASIIRHIPGVIVQGRYDVVCPMESAWALHRAWPEADLVITPDCGHSAFDPPNSRALVAATDRFAGAV